MNSRTSEDRDPFDRLNAKKVGSGANETNWEDGVDLSTIRAQELAWERNHPDLVAQFMGQWVALDGDQVISHDQDLAGVLERANETGHPSPFILFVSDPTEASIY